MSDAAAMDRDIESLMDCKLLSEEGVEELCKKVRALFFGFRAIRGADANARQRDASSC